MALLSKSVATTCFTVEENNNYFQPIVLLHSMIGYWHRHARLLCGFLIKYRPYEYMRILSVRLSVCNAWSTIGYHSNRAELLFLFSSERQRSAVCMRSWRQFVNLRPYTLQAAWHRMIVIAFLRDQGLVHSLVLSTFSDE